MLMGAELRTRPASRVGAGIVNCRDDGSAIRSTWWTTGTPEARLLRDEVCDTASMPRGALLALAPGRRFP
jgi:hypothetical protein